jgi:hypothetical protein
MSVWLRRWRWLALSAAAVACVLNPQPDLPSGSDTSGANAAGVGGSVLISSGGSSGAGSVTTPAGGATASAGANSAGTSTGGAGTQAGSVGIGAAGEANTAGEAGAGGEAGVRSGLGVAGAH